MSNRADAHHLAHGKNSRAEFISNPRPDVISLVVDSACEEVATGKYHSNGNTEAGRMSKQEMRAYGGMRDRIIA